MNWLLNPWRGRDAAAERRNLRLARFRKVLQAAQATTRYGPTLERAGIRSPKDVGSLCSLEEALNIFPYIDWEQFRGSPEEFSNSAAAAPEPPPLPSPGNRRMRTAVLGASFLETELVRMFPPDSVEQVRQFDPEAIAAPVATLLRLAELPAASLPARLHAVIAFTGLEHGALSEAGRDTLWEVFEAPVFEQCLGPDGAPMAWECEAHAGLHIAPENAIFEVNSRSELAITSLTAYRQPALRLVSSLGATLTDELCGCGQPGSRLVGLASCPAGRQASPLAAASSG